MILEKKIRMGLGNWYLRRRFYEKAIAQLTKVIEKDLNNSEAYYLRGLSHYEKADFEIAISDITKAIEMRPNYAEAYFDRARFI